MAPGQVWLGAVTIRGEPERVVGYDRFMHFYNHHRPHGALGWLSPMDTLTRSLRDNVPGEHS